MSPVDASTNPGKIKYSFSFKNFKPKLKVGDFVKNSDKHNNFSKRFSSNWNTELFKFNQNLKIHPPIHRIEHIGGEVIRGKDYEQESSKSEFDVESKNKILESLNISLNINKNNDNKKQIKLSETSISTNQQSISK